MPKKHLSDEEFKLVERFVDSMESIADSMKDIRSAMHWISESSSSPEMGEALKGLANLPGAISQVSESIENK